MAHRGRTPSIPSALGGLVRRAADLYKLRSPTRSRAVDDLRILVTRRANKFLEADTQRSGLPEFTDNDLRKLLESDGLSPEPDVRRNILLTALLDVCREEFVHAPTDPRGASASPKGAGAGRSADADAFWELVAKGAPRRPLIACVVGGTTLSQRVWALAQLDRGGDHLLPSIESVTVIHVAPERRLVGPTATRQLSTSLEDLAALLSHSHRKLHVAEWAGPMPGRPVTIWGEEAALVEEWHVDAATGSLGTRVVGLETDRAKVAELAQSLNAASSRKRRWDADARRRLEYRVKLAWAGNEADRTFEAQDAFFARIRAAKKPQPLTASVLDASALMPGLRSAGGDLARFVKEMTVLYADPGSGLWHPRHVRALPANLSELARHAEQVGIPFRVGPWSGAVPRSSGWAFGEDVILAWPLLVDAGTGFLTFGCPVVIHRGETGFDEQRRALAEAATGAAQWSEARARTLGKKIRQLRVGRGAVTPPPRLGPLTRA